MTQKTSTEKPARALNTIADAIADIRAGKVVIVVDDENRENEGDFIAAAEKVTPEMINFMVRHTPGYLCIALSGSECDRLDLHPQAQTNTSLRATPMAVSVPVRVTHSSTTACGSGVCSPSWLP